MQIYCCQIKLLLRAEGIRGACTVSFSSWNRPSLSSICTDILAWRRQNSPECLSLIMRGIKKPTPVSATLLLTHHDVLWAGGMSLSPSRSGVDSASFVIQHTEEVALRVVDASSICIKANTRAPSGRANTVVMGVIREIGSNITSHTGSLKPMSFYTSKCFPNVL